MTEREWRRREPRCGAVSRSGEVSRSLIFASLTAYRWPRFERLLKPAGSTLLRSGFQMAPSWSQPITSVMSLTRQPRVLFIGSGM
jgi:hypothetical protein